MAKFRLVKYVTAVAFITVGVAGCGNATNQSKATNSGNVARSSGSSNDTGSGKSSKKIVLHEMDYLVNSGPGMKKLIADFESKYPNVTVKRVVVPSSAYTQKVLQESTVGGLPDILMINNPDVPVYASTGALEPLANIGTFNKKGFSQGSINEGTYNGKLYAVPSHAVTLALYYNKAMFAKAGIKSPPKTWAELRSDSKKLTHGSVYGFGFSGKNAEGNVYWQLAPFLWTAGGNLSNKIDSAATKQTLDLLQQLVKDGSMPQNVINWNQSDVQNQFEEGKLGMMINGNWIVGSLNKVKGLKYGIAQIPAPKAGDTVVNPLGGETWAVPKSKNKAKEKAALNFIKLLTTNKSEQIAWNISGQTVPTYQPAVNAVVKKYPFLKVFSKEVANGQPLTGQGIGTHYPKIVNIWGSTVASVVTGSSSVSDALKKAKTQVSSVLNQ